MFSYACKNGSTNTVNALKLAGARQVNGDLNNDVEFITAHLMLMSLLGKNTVFFFVSQRTRYVLMLKRKIIVRNI